VNLSKASSNEEAFVFYAYPLVVLSISSSSKSKDIEDLLLHYRSKL